MVRSLASWCTGPRCWWWSREAERVFSCVASPTAGANLGRLPDPKAVEQLGLPIIPSGDSPSDQAQTAVAMGALDAGASDRGVPGGSAVKQTAKNKAGKVSEVQINTPS